MGYYHIELSAKSKELCTIVTQWGKYEYQQIPMGMCNIPKIFLEKMSERFVGLDTVRVYIDDILYVTKVSCTEHLTVLKYMFARLQKDGLKVNAPTNLTIWVIFMPIPKKVEAIQSHEVPKTCKQLRQFIGMINFYRDMW